MARPAAPGRPGAAPGPQTPPPRLDTAPTRQGRLAAALSTPRGRRVAAGGAVVAAVVGLGLARRRSAAAGGTTDAAGGAVPLGVPAGAVTGSGGGGAGPSGAEGLADGLSSFASSLTNQLGEAFAAQNAAQTAGFANQQSILSQLVGSLTAQIRPDAGYQQPQTTGTAAGMTSILGMRGNAPAATAPARQPTQAEINAFLSSMASASRQAAGPGASQAQIDAAAKAILARPAPTPNGTNMAPRTTTRDNPWG